MLLGRGVKLSPGVLRSHQGYTWEVTLRASRGSWVSQGLVIVHGGMLFQCYCQQVVSAGHHALGLRWGPCQ